MCVLPMCMCMPFYLPPTSPCCMCVCTLFCVCKHVCALCACVLLRTRVCVTSLFLSRLAALPAALLHALPPPSPTYPRRDRFHLCLSCLCFCTHAGVSFFCNMCWLLCFCIPMQPSAFPTLPTTMCIFFPYICVFFHVSSLFFPVCVCVLPPPNLLCLPFLLSSPF